MNEKENKHMERLEKYFNRPMLSKDDVANFLNMSLGGVNNIMDNSEVSEIQSIDDVKLKYLKFRSDKRGGVKIFTEELGKYLAKVDEFNTNNIHSKDKL